MAGQTDCSAAFTDCLCDRDFWIDKDANDLFLHINQTFNTMMNIPKLKKLRELSDSIQESLNRNKRKARFLSTMAS